MGNNLKTLIIDKNEALLKKVKVSGNGRCNLTNNKNTKEFVKNTDQSKFLYPYINKFGPSQIMGFFEKNGVPLKEEDNNRIYPVSNQSSSIIDALIKNLNFSDILLNYEVDKLKYDGKKFIINDEYISKYLVLAIGGITYTHLGTSKKNFKLAKDLGLDITDFKFQECPINTVEDTSSLMGITLENINVSIKDNDKAIDKLNGNVLFTHFGLSGPAILNSSFALNKIDKPNISLQLLNKNYEEVRSYLIELINENPNKHLKNILNKELPKALLEEILNSLNIIEIKNAYLNKDMINQLAHSLSNYNLKFKSFYKPDLAFVSSGGISLKELDKKSLSTKKIPNLYVGGECLDVCGQLGGYNISIALSCGYAIGEHIKTVSND